MCEFSRKSLFDEFVSQTLILLRVNNEENVKKKKRKHNATWIVVLGNIKTIITI